MSFMSSDEEKISFFLRIWHKNYDSIENKLLFKNNTLSNQDIKRASKYSHFIVTLLHTYTVGVKL